MSDRERSSNAECPTRPSDPPAPGMEVVISGIAGTFPLSKNMKDLQENLLNGVDLISDSSERWNWDHPDIPKRLGWVPDLCKFDATFFGVHFKQANAMDPMTRILLESAFEAVADAGINPKQLRGSKTGVFIGASYSESERFWFYGKHQATGLGLVGCSRCMFANRISYYLGIHGPSYAIDSACSSSLLALEHAYQAIRDGICESAIVGGSNICLHPNMSLQYSHLGVLSPDAHSRPFDTNGNGYVRSETIGVLFLQRAKDAKRIYATVVNAKSNCDGYKEQGIIYPSIVMQSKLFNECYLDCGISPSLVNYIEAHGTGSSIGESREVKAIEKFFCKNRKQPLKIGSVKSNLGHSESASGICSIAKVLIAMETGTIPANLNYQTPREGLTAIQSGKIEVVSVPTPWLGDYAGINSFGMGGTNVHVLLKRNPKERVNNGALKDDLPRLVVVSGRTMEAVETVLNDVESRSVDVEYIRLLHDLYSDNIQGFLYRGYTVIGRRTAKEPLREINDYTGTKRPIWFIFSGMGSQWPDMGRDLMRFPIFARAIQKCAAVLKPKGIDIVNVITNKSKDAFDNVLNSFVGIAAIQIGLVDLLHALDIVPDNIIGHSVGELGCAYADGCFTAEQMILSAYSRGMASIESQLIFGSMAAIGLGFQDLKAIVPADIDIACHNSGTSATISGPAQSVSKFVAELQAKKIFAREVACSNIAYHSRYIKPAGAKLLAYLTEVIPEPIRRSEKWISSSVPQAQWSTRAAKYSSAEYQTNNLLNSVLFDEVLKFIPNNAITIEIAPHGLLQAILRRALEPTVTNIALTMREATDNVDIFLQALGKLHNAGHYPKMSNIYPHVPFPVSRGTPMIAPLIKWEHSDNWTIPIVESEDTQNLTERIIEVSLSNEFFNLMSDHIIDGRNLIPAAGYLNMVWQTLGAISNEIHTDLAVVFEDVVFHRPTTIPKEEALNLTVTIQIGSGNFEIVDDTTVVVSGYIRASANIGQEKVKNSLVIGDTDKSLTMKDVYEELRLRGYQYAGIFRAIKSVSTSRVKGKVVWNNNWVSFIDTMLQMHILGIDTRHLLLPIGIEKLVIDVSEHASILQCLEGDEKLIPIKVCKELNVIAAGGIEIQGVTTTTIPWQNHASESALEKYEFVAYRDRKDMSLQDAVRLCTHIALENQLSIKVKTVELCDGNSKVSPKNLVSPILMQVLGEHSLIEPDVSLFIDLNCLEEGPLNSSVRVMEPKMLSNDGSAMMAIGYGLLSQNRSESLQQLASTLEYGGFLLTRDAVPQSDKFDSLKKHEMHVIMEKRVGKESIVLARKKKKLPSKTAVLHVSNSKFEWLEQLKKILNVAAETKNQEAMRVFVVAEQDSECGILGLVKCLRKETGGQVIRAIIVQDINAPPFSLDNPLYHDQLEKDLAINVLTSGKVWGSYRHMVLPPLEEKLVFHGAVKQMIHGDLSSFRWLQGPMRPGVKDELLVYVTHCPINLSDVLLATGKNPVQVDTLSRKDHNGVMGLEYSGLTASGQRMMGIMGCKGFSNICVSDRYLRWSVPNKWTMEEAATVPVVYITCYYALYLCGNMRKGETILIHAGSGGVGQAAINLALHEGCEVFTTVGTAEKRNFIKETFPSIPDDHIGNSRDASFEQMVMAVTNGRGVDIVLNSLTNEKRKASVQCVADEGRFLEIGTLHVGDSNKLGLMCFLREISFQGAMLDPQLNLPVEEKIKLQKLITQGLEAGAIKPLSKTIFPKEKLEDAFRYMAAGKHVGKVIIKIREADEPLHTPIMALPRFHCDERKNYVILGDLGVFGMELADWLILHNAKNIVLSSRNGLKNDYQRMRVDIWRSYGVKIVVIAGKDASDRKDCKYILETAEELASVDGIFNLAVVVKHSLFSNQTVDTFKESFNCQAWSSKTLDELSRKLCRRLKHFVIFSSASCGRGNAGQTSYAMANSITERICENRVQDGLPGLAVQWGPVADIGLVADMQDDKEFIIAGTLQQEINSCLTKLDAFLMQDQAAVTSTVVVDKCADDTNPKKVVKSVLKNKALEKKTCQMQIDETISGIKLLLQTLAVSITNFEVCLQLNTNPVEGNSEVFLIPGVDGLGSIFNRLTPNMKCPAVCFQLGACKECNSSIETMASYMLPHVLNRMENRKYFTVVGYSFGSLIAIELVRKLELDGMSGRLILIDGAPIQMKALAYEGASFSSDSELEDALLLHCLDVVYPDATADLRLDLSKCALWEQKLDVISSRMPPGRLTESFESHRDLYTSIVQRLKALTVYSTWTLEPIKTPIVLLKPTVASVQKIDEDYGLRQVTDGRVEIHYVEGNHCSLLDNYKVAAAINGEELENADDFIARFG